MEHTKIEFVQKEYKQSCNVLDAFICFAGLCCFMALIFAIYIIATK